MAAGVCGGRKFFRPWPASKQREEARSNMSPETHYLLLIPTSLELGIKYSVHECISTMLHTQDITLVLHHFCFIISICWISMTIINCFSNLVELPVHILLTLIYFPCNYDLELFNWHFQHPFLWYLLLQSYHELLEPALSYFLKYLNGVYIFVGLSSVLLL